MVQVLGYHKNTWREREAWNPSGSSIRICGLAGHGCGVMDKRVFKKMRNQIASAKTVTSRSGEAWEEVIRMAHDLKGTSTTPSEDHFCESMMQLAGIYLAHLKKGTEETKVLAQVFQMGAQFLSDDPSPILDPFTGKPVTKGDQDLHTWGREDD